MRKPFVTIVIVNWNKKEDVIHLLDSLSTLEYAERRIVVVDNASEDGSAVAIRSHPLRVTLIKNKSNLGGTGGFNTGVRYALTHWQQKYIWLLDNDAEVTSRTLVNMVNVMESDASIGITGSCILSVDDRSLILEAGGLVDERSATWKPNLRYRPLAEINQSSLIECDYVPACSALVRTEIYDAAGVMDERYFLHWDDVDFGKAVRKIGYRVVAAPNSIVYHGTEKGYNPTILYYDVRNSLLYTAKHLSFVERIGPVSRVCLRASLAAVLCWTFGSVSASWHLFRALENFTSCSFGKAPIMPETDSIAPKPSPVSLETALHGARHIVLFALGSYAGVRELAREIRSRVPGAVLTLAGPLNKINVHRSLKEIDNLLGFDLAGGGITDFISVAARIAAFRFDTAFSSGESFIMPYGFFVKSHYIIDHSGKIYESPVRLRSLWKLPFVVIAGVAFAIPTLIKCLAMSRKINPDRV